MTSINEDLVASVLKLKLLLLLTIIALPVIAQAAIITVGPDGCNYTSIQAAINAASPGDTIEVQNSTYYENVNVTEQITLRGMNTGGGMPVVDASWNGSAITLSTDGIALEGFKATNSGYSLGDAGIKVCSDNNTIIGNDASNNNREGIFLRESSNNNTITGNTANYNTWRGIFLSKSNKCTISDNAANNNGGNGIYLTNSSNNIIEENNARNNEFHGISIGNSSHNKIIGNEAIQNYNCGIYLNGSDSYEIRDNKAEYNGAGGISVLYDRGVNSINGNIASHNGISGIYLFDSHINTIEDNTAQYNSKYGILVIESQGNILISNDLKYNGVTNSCDLSGANQWNGKPGTCEIPD